MATDDEKQSAPDEAEAPLPTDDDGLSAGERRLALKVGVFVALFAAMAVAVVLLLGQKTALFHQRVRLHTSFADVQGLQVGAAVWLSGVHVGQVTRIQFTTPRGASGQPLPGPEANPLVRVDFEVSRESLPWIGTDSIARVATQGLLGDRIVEITIKGAQSLRLHSGDYVQSVPAPDLNLLVERAGVAIDRAAKAADAASRLLEAISSKRTIEDVQGVIAATHSLLAQTQKGPGLAHSLFYDPRSAEALTDLITHVDHAARHMDSGLAQIDKVLATTDESGQQVVNDVARAARNMGDAAKAVGEAARDVNHSLARADVIPSIGRTAKNMADLSDYVRSGQGTFGALVVDPTVYEQLVDVLGGIDRSRILRGLVRFAISRDGGRSAAADIVRNSPPPPPSHGAPGSVPPPVEETGGVAAKPKSLAPDEVPFTPGQRVPAHPRRAHHHHGADRAR